MDTLNIEILEDGTVKTTTGRIGPANHANAEAFMRDLARMLGGTENVSRRSGHVHHHEHEKEHAH